MPFMNKSIKSAFIKRSRMRNTYPKNRSDNSKCAYNEQRNYFVSLLRKIKKNSHVSFNERDVNDNKKMLANRKIITFRQNQIVWKSFTRLTKRSC